MPRKSALPLEEDLAFSPPYRVMIVDDHPVVRLGLISLLKSQPGLEIVCEATTGPQAIEEAKRCKPELIILDLTLPDINGLEVLEAIRQALPETEVIVLTMHFSEEIAREALRLGAIGYVLKSDADTDLLAAVDNARLHQPFFTARLALKLARNFVSPGPGEKGEVTLTSRETEVVQLLAEGKSNKQVASELKVSTRTIESHRHHIMKKMGFTSFSDLVKFAVRKNLVEL